MPASKLDHNGINSFYMSLPHSHSLSLFTHTHAQKNTWVFTSCSHSLSLTFTSTHTHTNIHCGLSYTHPRTHPFTPRIAVELLPGQLVQWLRSLLFRKGWQCFGVGDPALPAPVSDHLFQKRTFSFFLHFWHKKQGNETFLVIFLEQFFKLGKISLKGFFPHSIPHFRFLSNLTRDLDSLIVQVVVK